MNRTPTSEPVQLFIHSEMDVLRARKHGDTLSRFLGFNELERAEIEIAIGEMTSNIVKYARSGGELELIPSKKENFIHLKIISRNIPRIAIQDGDLEKFLQDGFSSSGSLGIGLCGVKRLMDEFESKVDDSGRIVISAVKHGRRLSENRIRYSMMSFPKLGERLSGDGFYIKSLPFSFFWGIVDALGHGPEAHVTALKALSILENNHTKNLLWILSECHEALKKERGAAMCLGRIDFVSDSVEYISIGNVETRIYSGSSLNHLHSHNGTIGAVLPNVNPLVLPWNRSSVVVSCTDGISARFDLDMHILSKSPQEMAYYIINTFRRDYDDATVMTAK